MLTQAIENLLNRNLPRSPRAGELAAALQGKTVRIEARGLGWIVLAESLGSSLRLTKSDSARSVDAEISVQIDEGAGDHVTRAHQLPDLRRGFLVHPFGHG